MLRDSHGPKNTDAFRFDDHSRHLHERFEREAAGFRRELHREWPKALFVFLQTVHPLFQKRGVG